MSKVFLKGYLSGLVRVSWVFPALLTLVVSSLCLWFSFSASANRPLVQSSGLGPCSIEKLEPAEVNRPVQLKAVASLPGTRYRWRFGDETESQFSTSPTVTHTYKAPDRYPVMLTITDGNQTRSCSSTQIVHRPLTSKRPASSSSIIVDEQRSRVWVVNPDTNTVAAIDVHSLSKLVEVAVGLHPRSIAQSPDGSIWVINQDSSSISILSPDTGNLVTTIKLWPGSQPYAIAFSPDNTAAFVTLQATGQVLKLNPSSHAITASVNLGPDSTGTVPQLRGLAISHDSSRVLVTRFISPVSHGEVYEVDARRMKLTRTIRLAMDPGPDVTNNGRGVPNYLSAIAISPDGIRAWIPSKKDNTVRGLKRDGLPLTFENTVRTITSQIDLVTNKESLDQRHDFEDQDMAIAVHFSQLGDLAFIAVQGSGRVQVKNAYNNHDVSSVMTGVAPQGIAVSGGRLYVQNFLSRSVSVFDVKNLLDGTDDSTELLTEVPTVSRETLAPNVLRGKQLFYNSDDRRMNRDGYISCASCHLDGGQDGRVWDFTDRGEGLRNTTELRGRSGTGHGPLHWSANFDEVQDFENDIRGAFNGFGYLSDEDFHVTSDTLGNPKAGKSQELDDLAAYLKSLDKVNPSPYRNSDGTLTEDGKAGKAIFAQLNCASCHSGDNFTDSSIASIKLHNVGTIKDTSGMRMNKQLPGIDTPTLKGVWETAPYLHDGSAATLHDVLTKANPSGKHGATAKLSKQQLNQLVSYLLQIDESESPGTDTTAQIPLRAGWNLISLPLTPASKATSSVLSELGSKFEAIYGFDGRSYQTYIPGSSFNDLLEMDAGRGYWVYMNESGILNIKGAVAPRQVPLTQGWNLAGFNSKSALPISTALSTLNYEAIYSYNSITNDYSVQVPEGTGDLTMLEPGRGYWIYVEQTSTWTLP